MKTQPSKTYHIQTFGCQANELDSEKIAGLMEPKGYIPEKKDKADIVIINTCSVRQSAEDRVLGLIKNLQNLKKPPGQRTKIIVTGCMVGSAQNKRKRYSLPELKKKLPGVDQFISIEKLLSGFKGEPIRKKSKSAFVSIMKGCDNFCSYCVVPYAKGREVSRPIETIICEVERLVKQGYKHITLLGQNVNSYHKNSKLKIQSHKLQLKVQNLKKEYKNNFAILLVILNEIKGLEKISFLTSNPHDLSNDIIRAMKLPKIDQYLHLAVQSGDDSVLKQMNRKYTVKKYLNLIKQIRKEIPKIQIGTDIIVGFPGETKQQFNNTVKLCQKVKFNVAYIAKYSPRQGTSAYKLKDSVSYKEKKRRWEILDKMINKNK